MTGANGNGEVLARVAARDPLRRGHRLVGGVVLIMGCLFLATHLSAQAVTGNLQGRVLGPSGDPEAGVSVSVSGANLQGVRTTTTSGDGFFRVLALPPGSYSLRLARVGLRPTVLEDVDVALGRETTVGEVVLQGAPVVLEELVISAPVVSVDPVNTTVGANLDAAEFKDLPGQRDYASVIAILPHINEDYRGDAVNVGGHTGPESMYFIDGVNVTSPSTGGASATTLPYNFIRSIEVKTGGYEAQYGKALGAVVNAVTYAGTNDLEVDVFGFFTHSALRADPKALPTLREADAVSYDVGARIGGPILRDRLWYSAAYNPRIDRVEKEITGHGFYTDRRTAHLFAGKLTWQALSATNVELAVFGDPTVHHRIENMFGNLDYELLQPDSYMLVRETGGVTASLRTVTALGERLLLEASLAHWASRDSERGETQVGRSEPRFTDDVERTVSGGPGWTATRSLARSVAMASATLNLSRHTISVGMQYEDAKYAQDRGPNGSWNSVSRLDSTLYVSAAERFLGTVRNRVPTGYVQDAWRVMDRVTVNAGVRWSSQYVIGAGGGTAQKFPNEWQPRLGFVVQPGRLGTQRVFGSVGRFYQQEPLWLPSVFYMDGSYVTGLCTGDPREPGADCTLSETVLSAEEYPPVDGVRVEHFDEFTLGYERMLGAAATVTARGIHRTLRSSFQWGFNTELAEWWLYPALGTPGTGDFDFLPPPKRDYTALEIGINGAWRSLSYRASYVLSRSYGNYPGFYNSDEGVLNPGGNTAFMAAHQAENSTGLLPNDRTHVAKLSASYRSPFGLSVGGFLSWQSGSPLSEAGAGPATAYGFRTFLQPRGSAGRTPSLWDVNLRLAYDAPCPGFSCRFLLDALHIGNPQRPAWLEEWHYLGWDENGNPINENSLYGTPLAYQPPMMARVGVEVGF